MDSRRRRIPICAPSNHAVDTICKKILPFARRYGLEVCRFRGNARLGKKISEVQRKSAKESALRQVVEEENAEDDGGLDETLQDFIHEQETELFGSDPEVTECLFNKRLHAYIQKTSQDPSEGGWNQLASSYFATTKAMRKSDDPEKKERLSKAVREARDKWTKRYFEEKVDIVCVTFNSAMHETLLNFFHPGHLGRR
jgi:hypothetical protein